MPALSAPAHAYTKSSMELRISKQTTCPPNCDRVLGLPTFMGSMSTCKRIANSVLVTRELQLALASSSLKADSTHSYMQMISLFAFQPRMKPLDLLLHLSRGLFFSLDACGLQLKGALGLSEDKLWGTFCRPSQLP